MLFDSTINQHFISQVELRYNTSTPTMPKMKNSKIFSFKVDHTSNGEKVYTPRSERISKILFLEDLFTIDKNLTTRSNYESLFHNYEAKLIQHMTQFKEKIKDNKKEDISEELFHITSLKLINSFRNPFRIRKTLNTIGHLGSFHPTNPETYKQYSLVLKGQKPQIAYITKLLGVTEDEYTRWLRCLFMLLAVKPKGERNFIDDIIMKLLSNKDTMSGFILFQYSKKNHGLVISDRAIVDRLNEDNQMSFDMNLDANNFMRFGQACLNKLLPAGISDEMVINFKKERKNILLHFKNDDMDALKNYNQCAVLQSAHKVYCSEPVIYGVDIIPNP